MTQQVTAHQKFIRQTPRKLRLVAELIKGKKVENALKDLHFSTKRAARMIAKVLRQAQANAVNNSGLQPDSLKVDGIEIQEGPTFKRWRAVSRGQAHSIFKRTSHIKITVAGTKPEVEKGK